MDFTPRDFDDADRFLAAGRTAPSRERRKIGNNTWLERRGTDIAVRYHATDIITLHSAGTVTLATGGWFTVTTKARLNDFLFRHGITVVSVRGDWFLSVNGQRYPFYDGVRFDLASPLFVGSDELDAQRRKNDETYAAIKRFVRKLTPERWAEIKDDAEKNGAGGDCWFCLFGFSEDLEHLHSHVEEDYHHFTLVARAFEDARYGPVAVWILDLRSVRQVLRRYLASRLLVGRQGCKPNIIKEAS